MTIERGPDFVLAALYLSRCGRKQESGSPLPPAELSTDNWRLAYAMFFDRLGAGRSLRAFHNSLKASRDQFDSHVDSGRVGWLVDGGPKPLPDLDRKVLDAWREQSDSDLWQAVRPYVDLAANQVPATVLRDLEAELDGDEEVVRVGLEGRTRAVVSHRRERSPRLRAAAIELHGTTCQVCGFDFGDVYGAWGRGFIEVHHLEQLGEASPDGVKTDVARDLAVLCSNCHRMVHRKPKQALTLDELRGIVRACSGGSEPPN